VTRRVLIIFLAGVVMLGSLWAVLMLGRPATPVESVNRDVAEAPPATNPTPAPPATTASSPSARTPTSARPAEPRRRAAASEAPVATAGTGLPDPDLVTLRVDSDVAGAQVFVDRNFLGQTPLVTTAVKPGSHRLNVSAPGYEGVAESLELASGSRDVVIKLREVKLAATLAVVHKHRMGSCTGQLVATPQGIRYDTTDKGDQFQSALLDLETFEVDYLEKNLRLKTKQGKRYDFTDPDGNPDRLFVFHRDVDKARERLKKGDPPAQ
jgi:hypothetical protein